MHAGDPIPQMCVDWEHACKSYANKKDIPADKLIKCTLDGFKDIRIVDWIELDCPHFESMMLKGFMRVFL
jgi:glycosyltransferase A (GT-A) superfamily protein (DUF2064 family)